MTILIQHQPYHLDVVAAPVERHQRWPRAREGRPAPPNHVGFAEKMKDLHGFTMTITYYHHMCTVGVQDVYNGLLPIVLPSIFGTCLTSCIFPCVFYALP